GWGLLRGVMRRGTIVENNVNQTVASAVNNTAAGVIFTFPALFLMEGVSYNPWAIAVAAVSGAFLGTLFIIPLRKQMIELERLRFPSGIAVAEILRTPGASSKKSLYLLGASVVALDRKSTRLNSSHVKISYAVFCLKKKNSASYPRSFCRTGE